MNGSYETSNATTGQAAAVTVTASSAPSSSTDTAVIAGIAVPLGVLLVAALAAVVFLFRQTRQLRRRLLAQERAQEHAREQFLNDTKPISPGYGADAYKDGGARATNLEMSGEREAVELLAETPGHSERES